MLRRLAAGCDATALAYDRGGDVWSGTFEVPAGDWEYKAALNGSWAENYGAGGQRDGPNISFDVAEGQTVEFAYDLATHVLTITAS